MRGSKATVLRVSEKCKNILASNWQGYLHTIKADAKGSKKDVYTSKVKYILRKGNPFIWVPEKEMHNLNTIIDERGSFTVANPFPGPLGNLLRSIQKLPTRVALIGDVIRYNQHESAEKILKDAILFEERAISKSSYTVSGVLRSSDGYSASRSRNLKDLLELDVKCVVYKFKPRSCSFIDDNGGTNEVELEDIYACESDLLAPFSAKLIDGINQSEARRRALTLFCLMNFNAYAKDAYMLSIDRKGFEVLAKVSNSTGKDSIDQYSWKEYRIKMKEEAYDLESFCRQLVEMEEEAIKHVSNFSGI